VLLHFMQFPCDFVNDTKACKITFFFTLVYILLFLLLLNTRSIFSSHNTDVAQLKRNQERNTKIAAFRFPYCSIRSMHVFHVFHVFYTFHAYVPYVPCMCSTGSIRSMHLFHLFHLVKFTSSAELSVL
jgi:hypothetical protein